MSQHAYAAAAKTAKEVLVRLQQRGMVFARAPLAARMGRPGTATLQFPVAWTDSIKPVALEMLESIGGVTARVAPGIIEFVEEGIHGRSADGSTSEAANYWAGQNSQWGASFGASQWEYFMADQTEAAKRLPSTVASDAYAYWKKWGLSAGTSEAARSAVDSAADLAAKAGASSTAATLYQTAQQVDPGAPPVEETPWWVKALGVGLAVGLGYGIYRKARR